MAPCTAMYLSLLQFFLWFSVGHAWNLRLPLSTPAPQFLQQNATHIQKRAGPQTGMSTCGYQDGDPKRFRTANPGFNCRVDTINGIWGFCPTTVIAATDCGLPGFCVDYHTCSDGCGNGANTKLTTFTCETKQFCSFALLTFGVDQTYSYLGCGPKPTTDHYFVSPTAQATPTTTKDDPKTSQQPSTSTPTNTAPPSSTTSTATSSQASKGSGSTSSTSTNSAGAAGASSGSIGNGSKTDPPPNNTGAIIGGVIGGVAILCIFGIVAIYLLRRNRSNRSNRSRSPKISAPLESNASFESKDNKYSNRRTGGWGPRELPGSQIERPPAYPIELPS